MKNIKSISAKRTGFYGTLIALNCMLLGLAHPATAEKPTEESQAANPNYGLPTHRRDGGSRNGNSCVADAENDSLVALIPEKTLGFNASTSPKLFFYVPPVSNQKTLEFVLRNEQDELLYEAFLTTEGQGIMSVEVPADIYSQQLETEQNYHWYLSMICNPQQRSRDIVVEGWMRQEAIDMNAKQELDSADTLEKAELYNQHGFWYDAVSVLAEGHNSNEEQPMIQDKWSELLQSVGLADLASEPFIESELVQN
ncbi:DUF928 domain-containing protein [Pleurocapsa sp. PCC 7319]|uniref:DUF928 domain-containing protein n=1 Tax=Pleurocapsa sp. PCC 7319 TaxID=118161 RepID=UPI0003470609|nr:DUF928 domain-containing protein [Pleurocapsa sp. PCC 7319]